MENMQNKFKNILKKTKHTFAVAGKGLIRVCWEFILLLAGETAKFYSVASFSARTVAVTIIAISMLFGVIVSNLFGFDNYSARVDWIIVWGIIFLVSHFITSLDLAKVSAIWMWCYIVVVHSSVFPIFFAYFIFKLFVLPNLAILYKDDSDKTKKDPKKKDNSNKPSDQSDHTL